MSQIKPSTVNPLDQVNGDLKIGDHFMINHWCGRKQFVRLAAKDVGPGMVLMPEHCAEGDEGAVENKTLVGDVLEVLGVAYPTVLLRCHTIVQGTYLVLAMQLDARDFDRKAAPAGYLEAMITAGKSTSSCPCPECVKKRGDASLEAPSAKADLQALIDKCDTELVKNKRRIWMLRLAGCIVWGMAGLALVQIGLAMFRAIGWG